MSASEFFTGTPTYLCDPKLAEAFQIARLLEKPLLLEGEPGTGKTKLAQEFAAQLGHPIFEVPVKARSPNSSRALTRCSDSWTHRQRLLTPR